MPVGSIGKWFVLGTLVAALGAAGCGDDDDPPAPPKDSGTTPPKDAGGGGGTDAGPPKDAGSTPTDSGAADTGVATIMCGTLTCKGYSPNPVIPAYAPGCVTDENDAAACGLSTGILMLDGGVPPFAQADAPGKSSPSCGKFFDDQEPIPDGGVVDGGKKGNGKIEAPLTIPGLGITTFITYPGCCTPKGFCSGDTKNGEGSQGAANGGFGCLDSKLFFDKVPAAQAIPCDPVSGEIKPLPDAGAGDAGTTDAGTTDAGATDAGADAGNG